MGEHRIDFCNFNEDGAFDFYKGICFTPKGKTVYAMNCDDYDGSYMDIDANKCDVVNNKYDKKSWEITEYEDEVITCDSGDNCHFVRVG